MLQSAILALLLVVFIAQMGVGIIAPIMPMYALELGATGLTLGLMVAGFSIARAVVQPIAGSYSDRVGRKRFLLAGLLIYSIAAVTYAFSSSVFHLILIRLFHGVGAAMTIPMAMAIIADMAPDGKEGQYMGLLNIAIFTGIGGGPLIGGVFRDLWGMQSAFYAMAFFTLVALVLVLILLRSTGDRADKQGQTGVLHTLMLMLSNRKISGVLLSRMSTMTLMSLTFGFLPILMTEIIGATGTEIGAVIATRTFVNALLQTYFGRMADRRNRVPIITISSLAVSLILFFIPFGRNLLYFLILFLLMGIAEAAIWPALGAYAVEEGRHYGQGSMMGVFNMAMSIGILIGSMGGGLLMDLCGLEYSFYGIALFLAVCTFVSAALITSGERKEQSECSA